jgi:hypothetical protein
MITNKLAMYLLALLPISFTACLPDLSPSFGIVKLKIGDREVYFKREVRGLSYDTLVISPSDGFCGMPDPKSDFIFNSLDPLPLYYRVDNNTLVLYGTDSATPPEAENFPVKVVQHKLTALEFNRLAKDAAQLGLQPLEIQMKESKRCKKLSQNVNRLQNVVAGG